MSTPEGSQSQPQEHAPALSLPQPPETDEEIKLSIKLEADGSIIPMEDAVKDTGSDEDISALFGGSQRGEPDSPFNLEGFRFPSEPRLQAFTDFMLAPSPPWCEEGDSDRVRLEKNLIMLFRTGQAYKCYINSPEYPHVVAEDCGITIDGSPAPGGLVELIMREVAEARVTRRERDLPRKRQYGYTALERVVHSFRSLRTEYPVGRAHKAENYREEWEKLRREWRPALQIKDLVAEMLDGPISLGTIISHWNKHHPGDLSPELLGMMYQGWAGQGAARKEAFSGSPTPKPFILTQPNESDSQVFDWGAADQGADMDGQPGPSQSGGKRALDQPDQHALSLLGSKKQKQKHRKAAAQDIPLTAQERMAAQAAQIETLQAHIKSLEDTVQHQMSELEKYRSGSGRA